MTECTLCHRDGFRGRTTRARPSFPTSTASDGVSRTGDARLASPAARLPGRPVGSVDATTAVAGVSRAFFIAEPQANGFVDFADWCRLGIGGSYRAIAGAGSLNERLRVPSASISRKLGSF